MRHEVNVWKDPAYEQEPLARLVDEYVLHLNNRAQPISPETVVKYRKSLQSFIASIEAAGEPPVLGSVTKAAVDRWVSQQRLRGLAPEGIASRLAAVKVFTRRYLWLELEVTTVDLLARVRRLAVEPEAKEMLTEEERGKLLAVFSDHWYEDVRNHAFVAVFLATGLRFREVLGMTAAGLDRITGEFMVVAKGGAEREVRLSPEAMKLVRRWLAVRKAAEGVGALWTTEDGQPFKYWAAQLMFQRLKKRTGVKRLHAHLLRHTFGQNAIRRGAERALVQDLMGHKTDAMTRRYTSSARRSTAAAVMPRYAMV